MWTGETSEISSFFSPSTDQPTPFLGAKKTIYTILWLLPYLQKNYVQSICVLYCLCDWYHKIIICYVIISVYVIVFLRVSGVY